MILEARNIKAGYGGVEILHGISMGVDKGEIISIIGPNGAGKSTLMKTILGLLKPTHGKITFGGHDITGLSPDKIVRRGICYVPQTDNVFPSLTVEENLEMGAFIRKDDFRPRMKEVYGIFPDLKEAKRFRVGKLSGGQRQMVAMARALMLDPQVLLLDEPSSSLSPKLVKSIFEKIEEINKSGVGILMVEQNAREALKLSHRGYFWIWGARNLKTPGWLY